MRGWGGEMGEGDSCAAGRPRWRVARRQVERLGCSVCGWGALQPRPPAVVPARQPWDWRPSRTQPSHLTQLLLPRGKWASWRGGHRHVCGSSMHSAARLWLLPVLPRRRPGLGLSPVGGVEELPAPAPATQLLLQQATPRRQLAVLVLQLRRKAGARGWRTAPNRAGAGAGVHERGAACGGGRGARAHLFLLQHLIRRRRG